MVVFLDIFLGSFAAMVKVFLTCCVGVLAALLPRGDPLIPDVALRNLSRLVISLLIAPLVVYALGSSLTPALLLRSAVLIPLGLANTLFSYLFFRLLRPLHQADPALCATSLVAVLSPNVISMPIMVLQSLCELDIVNDDYGGDSEECFAEATSMLFVYSIGFNLTYWAVLYPILTDLADGSNGGAAAAVEGAGPAPGPWDASLRRRALSAWAATTLALQRAMMTPAMIGKLCPSIHPYIYLSIYLSIRPSIHSSVYPSIHPFISSYPMLCVVSYMFQAFSWVCLSVWCRTCRACFSGRA
jgi:hypothetical protein